MLVDSMADHKHFSLIDAFLGYHQIPLAKEDQEKMNFIVNSRLCYYNVMLFRLKNAGATCQRLVNKVFAVLIGKTMEVYVNDMITKSVKEINHVMNFNETLKILRHYEMKLDPKKFTF